MVPVQIPRCPSGRNRGSPPPPARLRHLAQVLHDLGPRPLFEYLTELSRGRDPWEALERYARLHPLAGFIAEHGGDRLESPRIVAGGRR